MFHAHRIRNIEKYPPTIIKKSYKSPESLRLETENSLSEDDTDNKDKSPKHSASMSADNATGGTDNPDIPDEEHENENDMQGEKKKTNEKDDMASDEMNQGSKSAANESTDTANNSYLGPSDFQPLLSLKNWSTTMYQKDELTVQCPECPQKFFYKSGLKHHYETHVRQPEREKTLYNCNDNDNPDYPLPTSGTQDLSRGKQKHKSSDLPKDTVKPKNARKSINSDKEGETKKRRMTKLPKRHRGKLIHMASDMNMSEDTECQRDMAEGNAVLE